MKTSDSRLYLSSDFFEKLLIFFTVAKKQVDALCESQFHFCKKTSQVSVLACIHISIQQNGKMIKEIFLLF